MLKLLSVKFLRFQKIRPVTFQAALPPEMSQACFGAGFHIHFLRASRDLRSSASEAAVFAMISFISVSNSFPSE